ncbi:MarR family transcriptional regulator [Mycolicibacterium arabiense]|uniref:MarR family transcriptional regulator n=1 Tax=Mycolicibacterium arabiense TaxID=1286181 RepID=A0A7I7S6I1_9MYCO|nr:MarR family winged helix-turn-helix transcriptional regulator [Mycolicibacterium arabiense]MCV7372904.1 winged helix-turn-helix transcriptional regulator [Mycolicibacterium arabiense]BBY51919.1 MarR family transcriptional regulator [Mycolicibacterium arabiense]
MTSADDPTTLTPSQQRAWFHYMRLYHRLEYEMNRHLQTDCGLSLGDYTVMNALSHASEQRMQLSALATTIGWERSRLSHHLQRMVRRDLVATTPSETDGRGTDVTLTTAGWDRLRDAAPRHAAWVRRSFFADVDPAQEDALAEVLAAVYENLLREGTLPRPDVL